jgi:energy-converting hydrogenase Eha subunit B
MTMVNNVIEVVNYVIAARPSLLNFVIVDIRSGKSWHST